MLTSKQKMHLKALANRMEPIYKVGKKELSNAVISMLDAALLAHELIKVQVLKAVDAPIMEVALDLSANTHAEVVQVIGRVIVLFRRNDDKPKITLE